MGSEQVAEQVASSHIMTKNPLYRADRTRAVASHSTPEASYITSEAISRDGYRRDPRERRSDCDES